MVSAELHEGDEIGVSPLMESLRKITERYGSDKAEPGRELIEVYEPLFAPRRLEAIRLLEIGVADGASLRAWAEYFPKADILGVDIESRAAENASERISILIADQSDRRALAALADRGPFDIVIDDGSHDSIHQKQTLEVLWPAVTPGGIYVVEDTHVAYFPSYHGGYREPESFIEYAKAIADDVNQRWHQQPTILPDLGSLQFYPEACVFTKRTTPFRGGTKPRPEVLEILSQPPAQ